MSHPELSIRFEELSAGRAMGDLSLDEDRELLVLGEQLGISPDLSFELLAASLEIEMLQNKLERLPDVLTAKLKESARQWERPTQAEPSNVIQPRVATWERILRSPITGWAAAAAILLFALFGQQKDAAVISPAQAEARLRTEAGDLIEHNFTGLGNFAKAGGKVVWSDERQQGFMTLTGIPVNDPTQTQYQLWIVDPSRDEAPVDGGVFDIPTDGSPVIVPIVAKLQLSKPQAFVITLEQPGGVVKSKQEQVVALAKG